MAKAGTPTLRLAGTASYRHHAEADSGFPCVRDKKASARPGFVAALLTSVLLTHTAKNGKSYGNVQHLRSSVMDFLNNLFIHILA